MNKWFLLLALVVVALAVGLVLMHHGGASPVAANALLPEGQTATLAGGQPAPTPPPATPTATAAPTPPAPRPTVTKPTDAEVAAAKAAGTRHAVITTEKGVIDVDLYGKDEPITVANFVKLAQAKFYDGLTFHRVEPGFCVQGGDPNGNGSGGPGYTIKLEVSPKYKHIEGSLAMASTSAPDSAGSQFYFTLAPQPSLDGKYAVFGQVTKGMDVVKSIAIGDKIVSVVVK